MTPEGYWQELLPPGSPVTGGYPARFEDGRVLALPLRALPGGGALASLIITQASFPVLDALTTALADKLTAYSPDIIVGLPTLGLTLASAVARRLGHARYVALGTSEKFWYRPELSVPLSSITTPDQPRRLFIDPRMLPLIQNKRIALVDDVISSGRSMLAGISLLRACGTKPAVLGTAMLQSERWRETLAGWPMATVLHSPLLDKACPKGPEGPL